MPAVLSSYMFGLDRQATAIRKRWLLHGNVLEATTTTTAAAATTTAGSAVVAGAV